MNLRICYLTSSSQKLMVTIGCVPAYDSYFSSCIKNQKVATGNYNRCFKINVIVNNPAYTATFVLPPLTSSELSMDALESVAGGSDYEAIEQACICYENCYVNR